MDSKRAVLFGSRRHDSPSAISSRSRVFPPTELVRRRRYVPNLFPRRLSACWVGS